MQRLLPDRPQGGLLVVHRQQTMHLAVIASQEAVHESQLSRYDLHGFARESSDGLGISRCERLF